MMQRMSSICEKEPEKAALSFFVATDSPVGIEISVVVITVNHSMELSRAYISMYLWYFSFIIIRMNCECMCAWVWDACYGFANVDIFMLIDMPSTFREEDLKINDMSNFNQTQWILYNDCGNTTNKVSFRIRVHIIFMWKDPVLMKNQTLNQC